jgi:ornithine cyclodeaminase
MQDDNILILGGDDILSLLTGREIEIIDIIRQAYEAHARTDSSLPHSTFLRFPEMPANRIIALPAYLGGGFQIAGLKWIGSFPANRDAGLDRASAVLILNSTITGRPMVVMEGSVISARRTAASAALAVRLLHNPQAGSSMGLIGCGPINMEVARFVLADRPELRRLLIFDTDLDRAHQFRHRAGEFLPAVDLEVAGDVEAVLRNCPLLSFATTAIEPHISDLSLCVPGTTILHVSLRDITPEAILSCDNVVDDIGHVCRARTSVHLAEQLAGNRDFIRCTVGDVLLGAMARPQPDATVVFSPFGLGILDIAVGKVVYELAMGEGRGTIVRSFLPDSWTRRQEPQAADREEARDCMPAATLVREEGATRGDTYVL